MSLCVYRNVSSLTEQYCLKLQKEVASLTLWGIHGTNKCKCLCIHLVQIWDTTKQVKTMKVLLQSYSCFFHHQVLSVFNKSLEYSSYLLLLVSAVEYHLCEATTVPGTIRKALQCWKYCSYAASFLSFRSFKYGTTKLANRPLGLPLKLSAHKHGDNWTTTHWKQTLYVTCGSTERSLSSIDLMEGGMERFDRSISNLNVEAGATVAPYFHILSWETYSQWNVYINEGFCMSNIS